MYQLKYRKKIYELPTKTLEVARKLEEFSKYDKKFAAGELSYEQAARQQHDFIIYCVGEQAAGDILGGSDLEKIDVDELLNLSLEIISVYSENAIKARSRAVIDKYMNVLSDERVQELISTLGIKLKND